MNYFCDYIEIYKIDNNVKFESLKYITLITFVYVCTDLFSIFRIKKIELFISTKVVSLVMKVRILFR